MTQAPQDQGSRADTVGLRRRREKRAATAAFLGPNPLLVGLDLAKEKHAVLIAAARDLSPVRRFMAQHSREGILRILAEAERERTAGGFERTVLFMEPTGYFWQQIANIFEAEKALYRLVSPLAVDRQREIEHQTFAKGDFRDAEHILQLGANGQWLRLELGKDRLFADLAIVAREHEFLVHAAAREKTRLRSLVGLVLPEVFEYFDDPTGNTARAVLKSASKPCLGMAAASFAELRERLAKVTGVRVYRQKIRSLLARLEASPSFGVEIVLPATLARIAFAIERWELLDQELKEARVRLLHLYEQLPFRAALDTIPSVRPETNAALIGLIGDPRRFDRARCLVKLAGSECRENQSGSGEGSHSISRRGRPLLRHLVHRIVLGLTHSKNPLALYLQRLQERAKNPLKRSQAIVATGNKYLRLVHRLCVTGQPYDASKLINQR